MLPLNYPSKMNSLLQKAIAKTIKKLRHKKDLNQEDFAHACGLDRTYISGIERMTRNPTIKSLEKIIFALDETEKDFLLYVIEELSDDRTKS